MMKREAAAHVFAMVYFAIGAVAYVWLAVNYASSNMVSLGIIALCGFYIAIAAFAGQAAMGGKTLADGEQAQLSPGAQKVVRILAFALPVPALAFCAWFWLSVATFNAGIETRLAIVGVENALFGKTVIHKYLTFQPPAFPKAGASQPSADSGNKDVDFGPYMATIQVKIKRNWHPPKGNESKRVVVQFKVYKDGTMKNLKIVRSSGLATADQRALDAVRTSTFPKLPEGAPSDVDIEFTFDYNVFNGHNN